MRICFLGDIVGDCGRRAVRNILPDLKRDQGIDCCIINAENAAHGLGCNTRIIKDLSACGCDCITLGNHTFSKSGFAEEIGSIGNCVRPSNISPSWPGKDYFIFEKDGEKLGVINLLGQVSMNNYADNPFVKAKELCAKLKEMGVDSIFVDFHAEATSEKIAMGYFLDGIASCVVGTHTHVQTADERILPGKTGYITDCGMCGAYESVLGMDVSCSLTRLADKLPCRYEPATGPAMVCGIIIDVDNSGRCLSIKRFCEYE
ncbi:MAG: TIGR00282 family metallophosphoesterase [Saccharofermentans sp.]|nr:TIGR00282 family metallophosphoesterase [Saccharofermentans sp.]